MTLTDLIILDYLIIASDSGRITIVEYLPAENRFRQEKLETFGKSGVRRITPGEYLACDPKGRACLIASIEKNKLVYVLNRDAQAALTISSPLEAHKPGVLVVAMTALDVGYANPVFAALEIDYSEADQDPSGTAAEEIDTQLVYYELDLGLNHVVRKWSEVVDPTASLLVQVPGGNDGPSGVLVCGEESITYRHSNQEAFRVPVPRRKGPTEDPNRKRSIICGIMHKLKGNGAFFFLLQSEDGDIFKVTLDMAEDESGAPTGEVRRLKIKYFDTVPPATSLCILKAGFLYVATQFGNYAFYQFEGLGDDEDEDEFTSDDFPTDPRASFDPAYFYPRPKKNLNLIHDIPAMNPLIDCKLANLTGEDTPQIYTACGNGARSTFSMVKYGLEVNEIVDSETPGIAAGVWTLKLNKNDKYDEFIVLSYLDATLVLRIGEMVEEASDTGFIQSTSTLAAQLIGDDSLLQIHPKGIRHIHSSGELVEWEAPQHRSIVVATTNSRQVAIALSSGEIIYFELDEDGSLSEYEERREMSGTVTSLSLGAVPEGRVRSSFLAVGCENQTVRVLSLDPETCLESKSVQALTAVPTSLAIIAMDDPASGGSTLYLHIGLTSGTYLRTVLDEVTGELTDTRQKFLGPKAVRLFQVIVEGRTSVMALSSRPWIGYNDPVTKSFAVTPLNYYELNWAANFCSDQCREGVVGIQGQSLRYESVFIQPIVSFVSLFNAS